MATIKTDTFTVGSNTTLDAHTSDTGGGWQGSEAIDFTALAATDDVQCNTALRACIADETITETDYFCEITGTMGGTATNDRIGLVTRAQDGSSFLDGTSSYYAFRMFGDSGWDIVRFDAGAGVTSGLSGTLSDATWLADNSIGTTDSIKMKMTVSGTGATVTITLELDFDTGSGFSGYSTVSTVSDTHANRIVTAGHPGIYMRNGNSRITYFNAEDLTGGSVAPQAYYYRYNL